VIRRLAASFVLVAAGVAGCGGDAALPDVTDGSLTIELSRSVPYVVDDPRFGGGTLSTDVFAPAEDGPWPTVVMFHGNGGSSADMWDWAKAVANRGRVVFVPNWQRVAGEDEDDPASTRAALELMTHQAACAVSFARATAPEYGGDPEHLTVEGWSAGGNAAVMAALAGAEPLETCAAAAPGEVQALVIHDGALLLADGGWDPVLAADPEVFYGFTPWRLLDGDPKMPIHVVAGENVLLGRPFDDSPGSWVFARHIDVDLLGQLTEAGYFDDDGWLRLPEINEWAADTLADAGYDATFALLPDSTHGGLSREGTQILVDTVVGAEGG